MIGGNYCFVYFGFFLVFQRSPGDSAPSTTDSSADTPSDDAFIDFPFNPVCPVGCATCSTYNGCVTCQTTHFLLLQWHGMRQTGTCVIACPSGFYGTRRRRHGKCLRCPISNCDECSTNATCTTCTNPFVLYDGNCVDRCPRSKPFATNNRLCQKRVDCEVGQWSSWETCSRKGITCGTKFGRQMRTRLVLQEPSENGRQCPTAVQSRKCQLKPCDCKVDTNESDPSSRVGSVDETIDEIPDSSAKKTRKPKKPLKKKCRKQRKNRKQEQTKTKSDEERRKLSATAKPTKKTTIRKKMTTTTMPPSSSS